MAGSLAGIWVDDDGQVHTTVANPDGSRETRMATFRPFAWLNETEIEIDFTGVEMERLAGASPFNRLVHADTLATFDVFVKQSRGRVSVDAIRPIESQFLLQHRERLFRDMTFAQVRRCQMDIESASSDDGFCDPARPGDRVLAIGLRIGERNRLLVLEEMTDAAEKKLLEDFNQAIAEEDPDVIEGHNIHKFDFDYLRHRCRRFKVPCAWGRYGQKATFRSSRLKVAERWIDFMRCDLPGRAIVDTYLLVQLYDITTRELTSYGLKDVAVYFGITDENSVTRTYIEGQRIKDVYFADRARFCAYLRDDLRETRGLADQLLPTYFEQVRTFPTLLQEATLRGATSKIDLLFLEEYYHARQAC
ncbi:MAG: 3'-5' exonuclease, partial [Opitutus sp.]